MHTGTHMYGLYIFLKVVKLVLWISENYSCLNILVWHLVNNFITWSNHNFLYLKKKNKLFLMNTPTIRCHVNIMPVLIFFKLFNLRCLITMAVCMTNLQWWLVKLTYFRYVFLLTLERTNLTANNMWHILLNTKLNGY